MENRRKALGKGLEQLFNNETLDFNEFEKEIIKETKDKDILEINLSDLRSNPFQPRKHFDEEKINELANSIKEFGVIEPIIVKKSIKGYEIVAGERRVKASKKAGLETIPAVIKEFSDEEMMQIALLENIQREDLSPIEEANAYKNVIETLGFTQEELSNKIGKSRSYVTNMIGLLRLPKNTQTLLLNKEISMAHARILSKLNDEEKINELAKRIINKGMNVRELEYFVSEEDFERKVPNKRKEKPDNKYNYVQTIMREKIGTMVKINNKNIIIPFDSEKDLERILDILSIDVNEE